MRTALLILVLSIMSVAILLPTRTLAADWWAGLCIGGADGLCVAGGEGGGGGGGQASCQLTICRIGVTLLYLINSILVPLLFAVAFITFLYGVAKTYIFSLGDEGEVRKGHRLILWGIIGFVIMISLWGLVNIVANTFGLQNATLQTLPTSYTY